MVALIFKFTYRIYLIVILNHFANATVLEKDIGLCESDTDCIVVPYQHCCGSTKRAINQKFLKLYNSNKEWQKFDNREMCALMGACPSDKNIKNSYCDKVSTPPVCRLKY